MHRVGTTSGEKLDELAKELEEAVNRIFNKYMPLTRREILSVYIGLTAGVIEALSNNNPKMKKLYLHLLCQEVKELLKTEPRDWDDNGDLDE